MLPEWTQNPPALAAWHDELALAWTGSDRRINVTWTRDGVFGTPFTSGTPACTVPPRPPLATR